MREVYLAAFLLNGQQGGVNSGKEAIRRFKDIISGDNSTKAAKAKPKRIEVKVKGTEAKTKTK